MSGDFGMAHQLGPVYADEDRRLRAEASALENVAEGLLDEAVRLRAENAALAAALEDIAGMLDWNRLQPNTPPDWRATGECAGMNHVCHEAHPDDPGEWCPVCVAEVAWCAWKMGVLT